MSHKQTEDNKKRVLFVAEDSTSLTVLRPIADEMTERELIEAEFLFCDSFWEDSGREVEINKSTVPYECWDVNKYLKRNSKFNTLPANIVESIMQRIILDSKLQVFWFDTQKVLNEIDPDLIVTANDSIPFLRHLIGAGYQNNVATATVQHGIYSGGLDPSNWEGRVLFPSVPFEYQSIEYVKRRVGYRYGITTYCNPYLDILFTMGDFFSKHIQILRDGYPCFGNTEVVSTGSPEYNGEVVDYSPNVSSILFLSQQKLETGEWDINCQKNATKILKSFNESTPVSIRSHPKDSPEKIEQMAQHFQISEVDSLSEDIARHDCVLTVNSTAIYEGVVQGKVCGILDIGRSNTSFAPLSHNHFISITDGSIDLEEKARERSTESQHSYLNNFCKMPGIEDALSAKNSKELIVNKLLNLF